MKSGSRYRQRSTSPHVLLEILPPMQRVEYSLLSNAAVYSFFRNPHRRIFLSHLLVSHHAANWRKAACRDRLQTFSVQGVRTTTRERKSSHNQFSPYSIQHVVPNPQ